MRIATPRDETIALPVDTYGCGSDCAEHFRFPRTRGHIEWPVLRPAGSRLTQQSDGQHSGAVKVSAVFVDVTQE